MHEAHRNLTEWSSGLPDNVKAARRLYFQCAPYIQTQITVVAGFGGIIFQLDFKKGDLFVILNLTILL